MLHKSVAFLAPTKIHEVPAILAGKARRQNEGLAMRTHFKSSSPSISTSKLKAVVFDMGVLVLQNPEDGGAGLGLPQWEDGTLGTYSKAQRVY